MTWTRSRKSRAQAGSWVTLLVLAGLGVGVSAVAGRYQLDILTTLLLYIAGASAWNLVGGFAGQSHSRTRSSSEAVPTRWCSRCATSGCRPPRA